MASHLPAILAAAGFVTTVLCDSLLAAVGAFTVGSDASTSLEGLVWWINFAGLPFLLLLGAASMGEAGHTSLDTWNAIVFCTGGVLFWMLSGWLLGITISVVARSKPASLGRRRQ